MSEATQKSLSAAGQIRVAIENHLEVLKDKRVNISGPHYKIVQAVAAHIKGEDGESRSYNGRGLHELEITLRECLSFVQTARMKLAD